MALGPPSAPQLPLFFPTPPSALVHAAAAVNGARAPLLSPSPMDEDSASQVNPSPPFLRRSRSPPLLRRCSLIRIRLVCVTSHFHARAVHGHRRVVRPPTPVQARTSPWRTTPCHHRRPWQRTASGTATTAPRQRRWRPRQRRRGSTLSATTTAWPQGSSPRSSPWPPELGSGAGDEVGEGGRDGGRGRHECERGEGVGADRWGWADAAVVWMPLGRHHHHPWERARGGWVRAPLMAAAA